jgi:hypothetical protein
MVFYSSVVKNQTEILAYDIKRNSTSTLTSSAESEYSPMEIKPDLMATVTVEKDSSQKIHAVDLKTGLSVRMSETDSIGYYCFLNEDTVVYFKIGNPQTLRYMSLRNKEDSWLADHPGRIILAKNAHTFVYSIKENPAVTLYQYDFQLRKGKKITSYLSETEDFFIHPKLGLMRTEGSRILIFDVQNQTWRSLYDLSGFGLKKLSRFVVSRDGNYLAVVNNAQ